MCRASAVDRLFQIKHQITRTCPDCGDQSSKEDSNFGISVSARHCPSGSPKLSLMDYVEEFHGASVSYTCESVECISKRERDAQLNVDSSGPKYHPEVWAISEAPAVLAINLKRGQFDARRSRNYKVFDDVDFPEELELTHLAEDGESLKYRLYGVVSHHGKNPMAGHWIASVRQRDGASYRTISDSHVEPTNDFGFKGLRHPWSRGQWFQPTALLYLRIGDEDEDDDE